MRVACTTWVYTSLVYSARQIVSLDFHLATYTAKKQMVVLTII